jgi:hypothetical protein
MSRRQPKRSTAAATMMLIIPNSAKFSLRVGQYPSVTFVGATIHSIGTGGRMRDSVGKLKYGPVLTP